MGGLDDGIIAPSAMEKDPRTPPSLLIRSYFQLLGFHLKNPSLNFWMRSLNPRVAFQVQEEAFQIRGCFCVLT